MIQHHKARRLALQGLCCLDVQGQDAIEALDLFIGQSPLDAATTAEARKMIRDVFARREHIDGLIASQSLHWGLARMAMVDRNILRLAVWELLGSRAPKGVVITEAIRLAKEFASAESPRFVNGVLDAAATRILEETGLEETGRDTGDARDKE